MSSGIEGHYSGPGDLARRIRDSLGAAGLDLDNLVTTDLAPVDEFHIRGRPATLELGERMELTPEAHVLDLGSGMGGPARTLAEIHGCRVTGIDLTPAFCEAANEMSGWLGLSEQVRFVVGDATDPPVEPESFDAVMTIHAAMNVAAKDAMYTAARQALKPGGVFAVYDVLQGAGGPVYFPVPWARDPSISHLATPEEMRDLLGAAGFTIAEETDSSATSLAWFEEMVQRMQDSGAPPVTFQAFLGDDFPQMVRNQVRNLAEDRIRTVTYICRN